MADTLTCYKCGREVPCGSYFAHLQHDYERELSEAIYLTKEEQAVVINLFEQIGGPFEGAEKQLLDKLEPKQQRQAEASEPEPEHASWKELREDLSRSYQNRIKEGRPTWIGPEED